MFFWGKNNKITIIVKIKGEIISVLEWNALIIILRKAQNRESSFLKN